MVSEKKNNPRKIPRIAWYYWLFWLWILISIIGVAMSYHTIDGSDWA
jgi:hypothetical protein